MRTVHGLRTHSRARVPPHAGGDLSRVEIPSDVRNEFVMRRKYPFGRLIVYSGATLLYDGPNPHEIDQVFPFAVYLTMTFRLAHSGKSGMCPCFVRCRESQMSRWVRSWTM